LVDPPDLPRKPVRPENRFLLPESSNVPDVPVEARVSLFGFVFDSPEWNPKIDRFLSWAGGDG
jgi:hypothetical protein